MSESRRAFALKLNKNQGAAQARQAASVAFNLDEPSQKASASFSPRPESFAEFTSLGSSAAVLTEIVNPVDYEDFVENHASVIEKDHLRSMLVFPVDDIEVGMVRQRFRTIDVPLPPAARDVREHHARECVQLYLSDKPRVIRKYCESNSGQRFSRMSFRAPQYVRMLSNQQFEIDGVPQEEAESPDGKSDGKSSTFRKSSVSSSFSFKTNNKLSMYYDLQSSHEDNLISSILETSEPDEIDGHNEEQRAANRQSCLFAVYPLPDDEEDIEKRQSVPVPSEHFGQRILVKCLDLKLELMVEPLFAVMALFDAKEKRKISENFHFDLNSSEVNKMLSHHGTERCMPSISRSAIFSVTYPNPEVYLVVKIEKVLQQGDISEAAEPYMKEMDAKGREKVHQAAIHNCERLGQYRMPFAWTAINLSEVLKDQSGAAAKEEKSEGRASTPEPKVRAGSIDSGPGRKSSTSLPQSTNSFSSTSDTKRSSMLMENRDREEDATLGTVLSHFKPVTLTVSSFFKQEGEKLKDEDLYKFLLDLRKPTSVLKRLKCMAGILKIDISMPRDDQACCLTPSLLQVKPYPDSQARPTREIQEYPAKEVFSPWTTYKNFLYVHPQSINFSNRGGSARNIAIKVQYMIGESEGASQKIIYGKSSSAKYHREAWTPVTYHNRTPDFSEELKIEMPAQLKQNHHLLFRFYHISCQKPTKSQENQTVEPIFLGYTWHPLLKDGLLQVGEFHLPVAIEKPHANYSLLPPDVQLPGIKWVDGHKPVFKVTLQTVSSIHTQDCNLQLFFTYCRDSLEGSSRSRVSKTRSELTSESGSPITTLSMTSTNPEASAEDRLIQVIKKLANCRAEELVRFLHLLLNKLFQLLIRPSLSASEKLPGLLGVNVSQAVFETLGQMVQRLHELLPDQSDRHGRNRLLAAYVQHIFDHPPISGAKKKSRDSSSASLGKGMSSSNPDLPGADPDLSFTRNTEKRSTFSSSPQSRHSEMRVPMRRAPSGDRLIHEELALQWVVCPIGVKDKALSHSWFFFDVIIKSIGLQLDRMGQLGKSRKNRFSMGFQEDISKIVKLMAQEIVKKHIKDPKQARHLNISLAFFIQDALSVMDRGYVFGLVRVYLKQIASAVADLNLTEFRLELYRIVCSHEHYVPLNLPLPVGLYPNAGVLSPDFSTPPISPLQLTSFSLILDPTPAHPCAVELTTEYRQQHFLTGLVLTELAKVLEECRPDLQQSQQNAISLVRDLLARHDSDSRYYQNPERLARVTSLYLPLLGTIMDAFPLLYKGGESGSDWATLGDVEVSNGKGGGETTALAKRLAALSGGAGAQGGSGGNKADDGEVDSLLSPECTKNLLICFLWILKNAEPELLAGWWLTLAVSRLMTLMDVLTLSVSCFEYKGKRALQTASGAAPTSTEMQTRLAETIMGVGSARAMMMKRRLMVGGGGDTRESGRRWGTTYRKEANKAQEGRAAAEVELDAQMEANLANESSLIVLDTLENLVKALQRNDSLHTVLAKILTVLLQFLSHHQSTQSLANIFATLRALIYKFPELLFEEEVEQCGDLCTALLRHCGSALSSTRSQATGSLYLLMRQNYDTGASFGRIKVQVTVALSTIVAGVQQGGSHQPFNPEHLRRSLKTLVLYASQDKSMAGTNFPDQVTDLAENLNKILVDTVKMNECKDDLEMLLDLMHRIASGYQDSPDLRLTWLQNMAGKHSERQNNAEAAMCLIHAAGLIAEYLYVLEDWSHLPQGCVAFERLTPNVLEESAVSDDVISPDEDGICTGKLFSESGLVGLLHQAAVLFELGGIYEAAIRLYGILAPIYESNRAFKELVRIHGKMQHLYSDLIKKESKRVLGSFFRIAFYGSALDDVDGMEFIYREQSLTQLSEMAFRLQKLYSTRYPQREVEIIKDSGKVDRSSLNAKKIYIQVTYVSPYFEQYEEKDRVTVFEKNFNIKRFVYSTPFTESGKAHGDIRSQCKRKTVLTTANTFPYVKTRVHVIEREEFVLSPAEVAIEDMTARTRDLRLATALDPPNPKLLQVQLQGAISPTVNQGPFEIANVFLSDKAVVEKSILLQKLRSCFREFTLRCGQALDKNKQLISDDQREYQREMERNYLTFKERLAPMLPERRSASMKARRRSREATLLYKISRGSTVLDDSGGKRL
eukprot:m.308201 g.308201  ORF g.308201 m.308201 type:complete len:2149 (+) comp43549_c0_seq1:30-6476(+)